MFMFVQSLSLFFYWRAGSENTYAKLGYIAWAVGIVGLGMVGSMLL